MDASKVRVSGPLANHKRGFWRYLRSLGYTPLSAGIRLRLMAHLSCWLDERGTVPAQVTMHVLDEFLRHRRAEYSQLFTHRALAPLVEYLVEEQVIPMLTIESAPRTQLDVLLKTYEQYLTDECAVSPKTVRRRGCLARQFLAPRVGESASFEHLSAADITSFVVDAADMVAPGTAAEMASSLRPLLRYLTLRGLTSTDLSKAVPSVPRPRLSGLPKTLSRDAIDRALRSCDRRTCVGRRDYAVLLLLARLGLRAGEVAGLLLDDIDWSSGELLVRGKGGRQDLLPLSSEVGEGIAAYVRRGRPRRSEQRTLFLSVRAPHRPLSVSAVGYIVRKAGARVGVAASPHKLRHSVATALLDEGASLAEISQVLRHESLATTAIYTKVDLSRLRDLARPWPGGTV